ncbi:class I SAM-dependent methyltransferase [Actinoplanes sp. NPDC026619]|uniref:class I SAM-dependent methyltransferase n=1 Tax=Actinoplanes sp. NPDC026619 TaxID=3155798 RepID=UPI0033D0FCFA
MTRDWLRWHQDYDAAGSSLARRLVVVQEYLERALSEGGGDRRLISLCAGDGRDALPILARHDRVRATLVELDPELAGRARATAADLGLTEVDVRAGDAGSLDTYRDAAPAHVVMACGVFGNIGDEDVRRTVAALPFLLVAGGIVIWTRGRGDSGPDPSAGIRALFAEHGFQELAFAAPADAGFRVGMHRIAGDPARLFTFR